MYIYGNKVSVIKESAGDAVAVSHALNLSSRPARAPL
jgi:hypothetical protein